MSNTKLNKKPSVKGKVDTARKTKYVIFSVVGGTVLLFVVLIVVAACVSTGSGSSVLPCCQ